MWTDSEQARTDGPSCSLGDSMFWKRYRAIDAHDTRFDGQFVTAVSSTGIYCRPSCPAKTPKPRNVTFYRTSAAAHEAGFRACKRCLPEATPGTPEWNLRGDLAGRAMRLIADGVVDREGIDGLTKRLGYTGRHVHRLLVAELGAGPLALARARRAQSARALLVGSDLPVAQVAFAAGFGSVRQFNDTIQKVFATRPSDLRARFSRDPKRGPTSADLVTGSSAMALVRLDVELPVRQPFDAAGVFRFLASKAVEGVEVADLSHREQLRYARTLTLPHGPGAGELVATRLAGGSWCLRVRLELASLADVAPAVARVRRLLDLDADPVAIDTALAADPALAPLVARTPGVRVPGAVDPQELVIRALVGQKISVAAARTHLDRLVAAVGSPYVSHIAGLDRLFPTPAQIAAALPEAVPSEALDPDRLLRLPRRTNHAVLATARALADGDLAIHVGADSEALRAQLAARPGIGSWTAAYIAMRVLGDPDSWLKGDVALLAGGQAIGVLDQRLTTPVSHRALAVHAATWAPWRSYAAMHLWQAATNASRVGKEFR